MKKNTTHPHNQEKHTIITKLVIHTQENHTSITKMSIKRVGEVQAALHGGHEVQADRHDGHRVQEDRHGGHRIQVDRHGGHGVQVALQTQVHSSSQRCNSKTVDRNCKHRKPHTSSLKIEGKKKKSRKYNKNEKDFGYSW